MDLPLHSSRFQQSSHPYYPLETEILGYLANEWSVPTLLASFAASCALVLLTAHTVVKKVQPNLPPAEELTLWWFLLCGCIHVFFEGYYAYNFKRLAARQDLFGQLWKEYALSDSRYLTADPFVLCMETVTAVCWGPLSFILVWMIATQHPLRHPIQIIISLGQLYGDVLYYATNAFDNLILNRSYCRPEAYYYWGYYVLMNAFWIIIPLMLLYKSVTAVGRAIAALQKVDNSLKACGDLKKAL